MPITPAVSIVLPFRDEAAHLPECLESIRRQTLAGWELLAIDDGSRDGSPETVRRLADEDPRVRLLRPGRVGLVAALNLGIAEARAPLLARMDADDVMHPERLDAQREHLERRPGLALAACRVELFPEESVQAGYREYVRWQNECVEPDEIAANLYVESPFAHPSVMARTEVLRRLGGYADGPFPEDYELWLRMHAAGCRMGKVPRVLLAWRERPERTSRVDPRYSREAFDRLRARFLARDPRLHAGREVVVWGAGRKTRLRARRLMEEGIRPVAWIDIDPRKIGRTVWNLPVHPPEWLARESRPFVLVYVTNHGARELIATRLAELGYRPGDDWLAVG
ncbi:MAG TPA: glycosyltransferase [Longimicrobium sp.]|jgi:glycosyltransferase involved in cell wall biosynthesis